MIRYEDQKRSKLALMLITMTEVALENICRQHRSKFSPRCVAPKSSVCLDSNRHTLQLHLLGHIRAQPYPPVLLGSWGRRLRRQRVRRLDELGVRHAPRLGGRPVRRVPDRRAVRGGLQDEESRLDALALRAAWPGGLVAECTVRHVVEVVPELAFWGVRIRLGKQDELVWGLVAQPVPLVLRAVSDVGQLTNFNKCCMLEDV